MKGSERGRKKKKREGGWEGERRERKRKGERGRERKREGERGRERKRKGERERKREREGTKAGVDKLRFENHGRHRRRFSSERDWNRSPMREHVAQEA